MRLNFYREIAKGPRFAELVSDRAHSGYKEGLL
jgi:hypothetical protein